MGNTSEFASNDPYVDQPLWDDDAGICRSCGEIVQEADANYCDACQEQGE